MEQYRKSPRARFLEYDSGDYFITICTRGRRHYFGEIAGAEMRLSAIGVFVSDQLERCSEFCPDISIPLFVVMPNHLHFIVSLEGAVVTKGFEQRSPIAALRGAVTKYARASWIDFGWQSRYYDHMIRGARDGNNICEYILNNVAMWREDCFNGG